TLAYDLGRGRAVMFGGFDGISRLGDTWEWDGAGWQLRLATGGPSARSRHAMAHDFGRSVTVLHGGVPDGTETWEWDGAAWTQHGSTGLPKFDHTLVYDGRLARTTLFGGRTPVNPATVLAAVESYSHPVPGSYLPFGSSCPGSTSTAHLQAPALSHGPLVGQTEVLHVSGATQRAFFVFGWSNGWQNGAPLPLDLAAYGMPGCALRVSTDHTTSAFAQNGVVSLSVSVAPDPFLMGVRFFVQAFALDLAANPGGFTATNGLAATVGRN
ncbi:MAG: hypothetical protein KDE27_15810, partial [Planctomycetes bacterium]|nr:hypothetical protein [Planctomycetota bacterium]